MQQVRQLAELPQLEAAARDDAESAAFLAPPAGSGPTSGKAQGQRRPPLAEALKDALITSRSHVSPEARRKLALFLGRYLD